MTTQSEPAVDVPSGPIPCTPEEEVELQRIERESDLNMAHRDANLARLIDQHRGQFAMFYCDEQGEPHVVVAAHLSELYDGIDPQRLQAAIIERLDDHFEILAPHVMIESAWIRNGTG